MAYFFCSETRAIGAPGGGTIQVNSHVFSTGTDLDHWLTVVYTPVAAAAVTDPVVADALLTEEMKAHVRAQLLIDLPGLGVTFDPEVDRISVT